MMDPSNGGLTCITCQVVFAENELQRDHYKSDWHRYNLKRKVAELIPVTFEQFEKRLLAHKQESEHAPELNSSSNRCDTCNKTFQNNRSLENHCQSKKHKELAERSKLKPDSAQAPIKASLVVAQAEEVDDEWSDDDDTYMDDLANEEGAIVGDCCFFCNQQSPTMEQNLEHMSLKHGFYIPDLEYCANLDGLVSYIGAKVGAGNMCLWCNETGKRFRSTDACQKHMRDKGHCRVAHQPVDMVEFADYYDYSSMYEPSEQNSDTSSSDIIPVDLLDGSGWQLQLPSGATIGHRSLMRYYRQRLKPESEDNANVQGNRRHRDAVQKVLGHYKAIGWTANSGELVQRKAKDMKFMKRVFDKQRLKLGINQNRLFQFRGRED